MLWCDGYDDSIDEQGFILYRGERAPTPVRLIAITRSATECRRVLELHRKAVEALP